MFFRKTLPVLSIFLSFLLSCTAPQYLGQSFAPTESVDIYLNKQDIKKAVQTIGYAEIEKGIESLEKSKEKIIALAKSKGADAVLLSLEEVEGPVQSSKQGSVGARKKGVNYSETTSSYASTKKIIKATFFKYQSS
jgi:hypothetical protein